MAKRKFYNPPPLSDGYMRYGTLTTQRDESGRKVGTKFIAEGVLAYTELSMREQDYERFESADQDVDLKIKTYSRRDVDSKVKVKIGSDYYNVHKVDRPRAESFMYWFMSKRSND